MSTPDIPLPTLEQLGSVRQHRWHQQGEALLTFENLRSWLNASGLVLFTPRPQQLPAPAPSLMEAVLGTPNATPTLADTGEARSLLARLIAEGIAIPLNLLGTPGETPDFVASSAVFAYIFTLRGDKLWKQPPATSGPVRVSPLALATYTLLAKRPLMSAYDLTTQLGKEVTESAVLRALTELWTHLRVLPMPQPDGGPTLWELASTRFTKLMKAGANAGQPSALSALISLYLNTAMVATEEEIETFLSPLAARSRIRDVVHALMAARELETIAIEGRTMLHVAGEAPAFLAEKPVAKAPEAEAEENAEPVETAGEDTSRIGKFLPKPRKVGTGFLKRPTDRPERPAAGMRPAFSRDREGVRPPNRERERRPFDRTSRPAAGRTDKPSYSKPWQEERPARRPRPQGEEGERAPRADRSRPKFDRGDRPSFERPSSDRPRPSFDRGGGRPSFDRPRPKFDRGGDRPSSDRPRPSFDRRPAAGDRRERPAGRGFADRSFAGGADRPVRRPFKPREEGEQARPPRKPFRRAEGGERPSSGEFKPKPFGRKPFVPREGGKPFPRREGGKPFPRREGAEGAERRPFRRFDAPAGDRPARPRRSDEGGRPQFGSKPGGFAGKKPFGKPGFKRTGGAGKPAGSFDKFKKNAKPFGKRKPRSEEGESNG